MYDGNEREEIVFNVKSKNPSTAYTGERRSFKDGSDEFTFKPKLRSVSPERFEEMKKAYTRVAVHDYGDEYHLSEEERKKRFRYYEAFAKVSRCKRKYRKLDEYVKVYRLCLDCLKIVAEDNGAYEPNEFMKLVIKGDIKVFGLNFPKYVGRDRKDINWEYVAEFISDYSRDPSELVRKKDSPTLTMTEEESLKMLFDEDQLNEIIDSIENPKEDEVFMPFDEDDEYETRDNVAVVADKKETKKLIKFAPEFLKCVKEEIREQRRRGSLNSRLNSLTFELVEDDFEYISRMDRERGYYSEYEEPEFTGSVMNRKDYMKYLLSLETYENENIKENYRGKTRSRDQINEMEVKDILENSGWNIRNLYNNKEKEKKLKKIRKREKKYEEELKKRLMQQQSKNKKLKEKELEFNANSSKKKKKGKKKKKKKEYD